MKSGMREDAVMLDKASSYFVRFAFWAVFMIGIFDAFLSFLRVEGLHDNLFGTDIASLIALPSGRGVYFHLPLFFLAALIASTWDRISFANMALTSCGNGRVSHCCPAIYLWI